MPDSGGTAEQIAAVTDFTSIELHFDTFAQELTSSRIRDFNGVLIPTSMTSDTDRIKLKKEMFSGYTTTVDMSCKTFPKSIEVLSSYAGTEPLNE